ncbi:unnamed protein product [Thlaspi arvense]|uniref:Uncharacterized protein n=1 Tax=Thlaspi arvense TaxID=13288 RepID=A0AAU9SUQ7_THLAR|nr:unnamed protein product [Thlaspi arvense]
MIKHFSDTSFNSYNENEYSSDEESFPKNFAIGEGSATPKIEPNINEIFSSDEDMDYTRPIYQEMQSKQFTSKVMIFTFDDIPFEKWNDRHDEFHEWMNPEAITSPLELIIQLFTAGLSIFLKSGKCTTSTLIQNHMKASKKQRNSTNVQEIITAVATSISPSPKWITK